MTRPIACVPVPCANPGRCKETSIAPTCDYFSLAGKVAGEWVGASRRSETVTAPDSSMESIKRILARRSITPSMAVRFGAFFGHSEDFWHGFQVECDFRALAKDKKKLTAHIQPAALIAQTC